MIVTDAVKAAYAANIGKADIRRISEKTAWNVQTIEALLSLPPDGTPGIAKHGVQGRKWLIHYSLIERTGGGRVSLTAKGQGVREGWLEISRRTE